MFEYNNFIAFGKDLYIRKDCITHARIQKERNDQYYDLHSKPHYRAVFFANYNEESLDKGLLRNKMYTFPWRDTYDAAVLDLENLISDIDGHCKCDGDSMTHELDLSKSDAAESFTDYRKQYV